MSEREADDRVDERVYGAERPKAFIDAVVAIALTLLILPLMESVTGEDDGSTTAEWFVEHHWQLISFLLSFGLIAMFWMNHHRLFAQVDDMTIPLLWLCFLWLLTIVWMPVATALSGRESDHDELVKIVYIGTMVLTSLVSLMMRLYLRRHTDLHRISREVVRHGIAVDISMVALFSLSLVIALVFPVIGYYALFLMFLTGRAQTFFDWVLRRGVTESS